MMRYTTFYVIFNQPTGQHDRLGNEIVDKVKKGPYQGRFTEWTAEDVAINGRELTSSERKLLSNHFTAKQVKGAVSVEIDDKEYNVTSVFDLRRWTLLRIKGYRL